MIITRALQIAFVSLSMMGLIGASPTRENPGAPVKRDECYNECCVPTCLPDCARDRSPPPIEEDLTIFS